MGLSKIWKTVRSFSNRNAPLTSNVCNDPDSEVFQALQEDLVKPQIEAFELPMRTEVDEEDPLNRPFSEREFSSSLLLCKNETTPGLDDISYSTIKKLPKEVRDLILKIFNRFFIESRFPSQWRNTKVIFVPKPAGKGFRLMSLTSNLCKLFERLVHRRLESQSESKNWILDIQFGFRGGRSSLDCVSTLVTDISDGFLENRGTLALALDVKGAFSNLLPQAIYDRLLELGVSERIQNFVSFITSKKNLFFRSLKDRYRISGIGVPQGGVLSPLLFNLALIKIQSKLPVGVRIAMYADDILIYVRFRVSTDALELSRSSIESLTPWLSDMGLSISVPKTQVCVFSRFQERYEDSFLLIDNFRIPVEECLLYLGILLDRKLS